MHGILLIDKMYKLKIEKKNMNCDKTLKRGIGTLKILKSNFNYNARNSNRNSQQILKNSFYENFIYFVKKRKVSMSVSMVVFLS